MMTLKDLEKKLQKADAKQAKLYLFCNFVSLLLITAYSAMMLSPTVLLVLPEGGDSRKQMVAIFVLALFGCVVFTIYASGLFFRKKARQLGTLMALGASGRRLLPGLLREVLILSAVSSLLGIVAGFPFVWILWNSFKLITGSAQMTLTFDFRCLYLSAVFFVIVVGFSCLNAYRYLKKTNIMEVVHEEHRNEPVKEPGRWCGIVGILLVLGGAVLGYMGPVICYKVFNIYSPVWINILYAPVFVGLYMIMLHTVVYGWRSYKKYPYKNIIARSMMKFQGKQTVNNLLVSTVLIAGSVFGIFYLPIMNVGRTMEIGSRPYDYYYHYRSDQEMPGKEEISALAGKYGLAIKDFKQAPYLSLGMDGITEIEEEDGNSFHYERIPLLNEGKFFSEESYKALTGENISVEKGSYMAISNTDETGLYYLNETAETLTNMCTLKSLSVGFGGYAHYDLLMDMVGYYVLNNEDYEGIAAGLTEDWMGRAAFFNMEGEDSYEFAQDFFYTLVASSGPECEIPTYYDRVSKYYANQMGEVYWGDTDRMTNISYLEPDTSDFRGFWKYMPKSRILDKTDFYRTYSVFLMMFLFIAIICSLAAMIIDYTRCMTIILNNRYVFEDLKRLGASPSFLQKEMKGQAGPVFKIPTAVGMIAMYLLYTLLMFGNDGKITESEVGGLLVCFFILVGIGGIYYLVYQYAVKNMYRQIQN